MKGIQAIPSYLYIIIALVVGVIMLIMISRYSMVFIQEKDVVIGGDETEISENIANVIKKCWNDHRKGLDDNSAICREIKFESNLKIHEKDLNNFLNCEILPNSNCYIYPDTPGTYDCSKCSSPYFDDTDKIIWFAEPENTELKINYFGATRRIVVVGSPCDDLCICKRNCKQLCMENLPICEGCFESCE